MNKLLFRFLSFSSAKFICCSTDHYVQAQVQPYVDNKNNIYGGIEASPEEYPFQVALVNSSLSSSSNQSQIVCGGSLVAPNYVLTAAQCSNKATSVQISRHGDNSTLLFEEIEIENEIVHPYYSYPFYDSDNIMVVKLKSNSMMQPDGFMQFGDTPEYREVGTILEWASNSNDIDGLNRSDVLIKKEVHIMSTANCSEAFGGNISYYTIYKMICASSLPDGEGGQGFREGDYGGPLMKGGFGYDGQQVQVGIISYGKDMTCSDEDKYPGLYTSVERHRDFISCVVNGGTEECGVNDDDHDYGYYWDDDCYSWRMGLLVLISLFILFCFIVCSPITIPLIIFCMLFPEKRINVDARLFDILKAFPEPVDISYDEIMQYFHSLIPFA